MRPWRPSNFSKLYVFGLILLVFTAACEKKVAPPPEPAAPPPPPKTTLPVGQLMGLTINGQDVAKIAAESSDTQGLEGEDLKQSFGIQNEKYLETALKNIQSQLQTGSPLKNVSVFLGLVPKDYAAVCLEDEAGEMCLIEPVVFNCPENFEQKNWSEENYRKLCLSLGRLKALKQEKLVALFDGDHTLWYQDLGDAELKKAVDSKRVIWDVAKAELLSIYPEPTERVAYVKTKTPYEYYEELYEKVGPLWNYNFGALAFKGLPLKETLAVFKEIQEESYRPIPFPEMVELLKYLQGQGILVGVVSASPSFAVYPMVESLNAGINLDQVAGLDVFLKNPQDPAAQPIRLSRLVNQGLLEPNSNVIRPFKSYQEVVDAYGDWLIVDVDQVINAQGGKSVQARSIARRHVAKRNRKAQVPSDKISIDDMRIILIGGDNFAIPTDIENPLGDRKLAATEAGNDQGLAESLAFMKKRGNLPGGTDLLLIRSYELGPDQKPQAKTKQLENFEAFVEQQRLIRPGEVGEILVQGAITDISAQVGTGGFLKVTPTAETQPETQAETQGLPETQGTETAPQAGEEAPSTQPSILPPTPEAPPEDEASPTAPSAPALPGTTPPEPAAPAVPSAPSPAGEAQKLPPLPPAPPSVDGLP